MAKHYKWEGTSLSFNVPGAGDASLDVATLPEAVKAAALQFGIQTAVRNATAGLFEKEPQSALKRIQARIESWLKGEWKAAATEGESRTSLLARAVAEVGGITVEEAADAISETIGDKVRELGLDSEDDEDKQHIRKIGTAVRDGFAEAEGVPVVLARIRAEEAQKRAAQAAADAAAKASDPNIKPGVKLADLLKK